jgi:peptidoglycan/LPS O-acetylase OafA/YrhL
MASTYAFPVQQLVVWATEAQANFLTTLAISSLVTVAFAFVSWHWIERPALLLKPQRTKV